MSTGYFEAPPRRGEPVEKEVVVLSTDPVHIRSASRADARRNRDSILKTAARHFASRGVNASLDEIAREAGVGPGTLYRHFPSREALLAATLMDKQAEVLANADAARKIASSEEALATWLRALQDYLCTYDGLPTPVLAAIKEDASLLALSCEKLITLTGEFLSRAQQEGRARPAIKPDDLFLTVLGVAWVINRAKVDGKQKDALEAIIANGYRQLQPPTGETK